MSTYDTYLSPFERNAERKPISFGTASVAAVTGMSKLAQAFVKALLTTQGTDLSDRTYGTDFASLRGSNITDQASLQAIIVQAVSGAEEQVKARYNTRPNEPRLLRAVIDSVTYNTTAGSVDVRVSLYSPDGSVAFNVPTTSVLSAQAARVTPTIGTLGSLLPG